MLKRIAFCLTHHRTQSPRRRPGSRCLAAQTIEAPAFAGATGCETRSCSTGLLFVLALLLAGAAQAQEVYTTDDGVTYTLDPIEGGAVLVNADDPADEFTITHDCGAHHSMHGDGSWAWDGAVFLVIFAGTELRFDGPLPLVAPACGG